MDAELVLRQLGGVALNRQVQSRGVSESAIRAALRAGCIERVERGVLGLLVRIRSLLRQSKRDRY